MDEFGSGKELGLGDHLLLEILLVLLVLLDDLGTSIYYSGFRISFLLGGGGGLLDLGALELGWDALWGSADRGLG